MQTTVSECVDALRNVAEQLGESPTKAQYESLGMTPASGTIIRVMGSWNEAKQQAGLETFDPSEFGGTGVQPKPDQIELPAETDWEDLSGHQRWYRKNRQYSRDRKTRRRRKIARWIFEYKRDQCECEQCGETDPACLEFHHRDPEEKQFSVSQRVNRGHSIEKIRAEIDRCAVLCANCHRKEHYEPPEEVQ